MHPRRLLLAVGVALALAGSGTALRFVDGPVHTLLARQDPATITVYVTKTGEKYHRDGCRYLSRSRIAITLKDAVARGLGPCSICKPPTIRKGE